MDLHEIWQENKRWIIGVLIGVVVFFIAKTMIGSMYDADSLLRRARQQAREVAMEPRYDSSALAALAEEDDALAKFEAQLLEAVTFPLRSEFDLTGKGMFDLHFDQVSREVRARVLGAADRDGVDVDGKRLAWPTSAASREETQAVLWGLDLLDDAADRAFKAAQAAKQARPEALGLVSIDELRVEGSGRDSRRSSRRRAAGDDVLKEQKVSFRLRADADTVYRMLESFRYGGRPIAVAELSIKGEGRRPGEPLTVSGALVALQVME